MEFAYDTHLCLISDQVAPNLLPALDDTCLGKTKKVIMLVSPRMREKAQGLAGVLQRHNIVSETIAIADAYDFTEIQDVLLHCLAGHEQSRIALNLTGGTKIMTVAAQSVFAMDKRPMFYVREHDGKVLIMNTSQTTEILQLQSMLRMSDYLHAYGYKIQQIPNNFMKKLGFAKEMAHNYHLYRQAAALNHCSSNENDENAPFYINGDVSELLALCRKYNLVLQKGNMLQFCDEISRSYVRGGWLEEFVFDAISSLDRNNVQDKQCNMKIVESNTENEIDVAFMAKNRLHIIECKTANLTKRKAGTDALYKLEAIKRQTGNTTRAMLISYRVIGRADADRAKAYGIDVIQGKELASLRHLLTKWIAR